jgi:hypothetical protein
MTTKMSRRRRGLLLTQLATAVDVAVVVWLSVTGLCIGAVMLLRRILVWIRFRSWDREIRALLADNGGGWAKRSARQTAPLLAACPLATLGHQG